MNLDEVERLAMLQCTQAEIAAFFDVSQSTVEKRMAQDDDFRAAVERGMAKGRISVRRMQLRLLDEGNATMAVWLGKQLLGQRDSHQLEHSGPGGEPLKITVERIQGRMD